MKQGLYLVYAHVAVFFMGMAGVLAGASGFDPWRSTSYRVTFGGIALLLVCLFLRKRMTLPDPKRIAIYLALGVVLSVHWFTFFKSIDLLGVILGSALIGLEPLIIAIFAHFFLKEHMNTRTKWAMGIGMIGFAVLAMEGSGDSNTLFIGLLWALVAYILFAILVIANRVYVQSGSPLLITTIQMIGAIPLTLIMIPGPWLPADSIAWAYALGLGLLCTGLAHTLYNLGMRALTAPVMGLLLSLEVVYGILGGWVIGDSVTLHQAIGALLISNILVIDLVVFARAKYIRSRRANPTIQP